MANVGISTAIVNTIREGLAPGITEFSVNLDPVHKEITQSRVGVVRDKMGRNWQVLHTFQTGLAGAGKWASSLDGVQTDGTLQNLIYYTDINTYPTHDESASPGYFQRTVTLKKFLGNLFLPHDLIRADSMNASIGPLVAAVVKGSARNTALSKCQAFWAPATGAISTITSWSASGAIGTFTPGSSGPQARRFQPGQLIDVYSAAYVNRTSTERIVVTAVDYMNNSVVLQNLSGDLDAGSGLGIANTDLVVLRGSTSSGGATYGPSGMNSWIKDSGTIFGITLANPTTSADGHPEFKSLLVDMENNLLTSTDMDVDVSKFDQALGGMADLDTIVFSHGVLSAFYDNLEGFSSYQRQGAFLNPTMGRKGLPAIHVNGRDYTVMVSRFAESGDAYAIKLGDGNIKVYVPPRLTGAGSDSRFDPMVEFVGNLNSGQIFKPYHVIAGANAGDGIPSTELTEAPFTMWLEYAPEQPQSLKWTNCGVLTS